MYGMYRMPLTYRGDSLLARGHSRVAESLSPASSCSEFLFATFASSLSRRGQLCPYPVGPASPRVTNLLLLIPYYPPAGLV
jgi:hypothetical protein